MRLFYQGIIEVKNMLFCFSFTEILENIELRGLYGKQ